MEVALRTIERKTEDKVHGTTSYRPVGSVAVAIVPERLRMAWVTRCGYHASPLYRDRYPKPVPAYFAALVGRWNRSWLDQYNAAVAGKQTWGAAWSQILPDVQSLGLSDVRGDVSLFDTWQWSRRERKEFGLFQVDHSGLSDGGASCGQMVEETRRDGVIVTRPAKRIDYRSLAAVSADTLAEIDDASVVFDPRYNYTLPKTELLDVTVPDVTDREVSLGR
jgi:hypothetical protein